MENVTLSSKFINSVKSAVCKLSDKDGFGYSIQTNSGLLGGERTIKQSEFIPLQTGEGYVTGKLPIVSKSKNYFGTIQKHKLKSFIAHGRLSTNQVNLANTHPFYNGKVSLVHNGVVQDSTGNVGKLSTTCDTEILLNYWNKGGVDAIEKNVTGYYALAIQDKDNLHIIRDDRARLFIAYSKTIKSYVIATTADIIYNVARDMDWNIEQCEEILENTYTVFNRNEIVSHREIKPKRASNTLSFDDRKALGLTNDKLGEKFLDNVEAIGDDVLTEDVTAYLMHKYMNRK
jgi:hypothetical protein